MNDQPTDAITESHVELSQGDRYDDDGPAIDNLFSPQELTPVSDKANEADDVLVTPDAKVLPKPAQSLVGQTVTLSQADGTRFPTPTQILGSLPGRRTVIVSAYGGNVLLNGRQDGEGFTLPAGQNIILDDYDGQLFAIAAIGAAQTVSLSTMILS